MNCMVSCALIILYVLALCKYLQISAEICRYLWIFAISVFGEMGLKIRPEVFRHDNYCDVNEILNLLTNRNGKQETPFPFLLSQLSYQGQISIDVTRYLLA